MEIQESAYPSDGPPKSGYSWSLNNRGLHCRVHLYVDIFFSKYCELFLPTGFTTAGGKHYFCVPNRRFPTTIENSIFLLQTVVSQLQILNHGHASGSRGVQGLTAESEVILERGGELLGSGFLLLKGLSPTPIMFRATVVLFLKLSDAYIGGH